MTKNATKRAFMLSLLSLLMCCTMLLGTTFAWFTDTVTSTGNRIVAGTLKVDLLKFVGNEYVSVADATDTDIFDGENGVNWEPGKTEIVYLAVENKGTLALKYDVKLDIEDKGLVGALEYVVINPYETTDGKAPAADWNGLKALANTATGDLQDGYMSILPTDKLDAKATDYFALAVHMKEDAGNEYQATDIVIDITVVATQLAQEEDSFGKYYDGATPWYGAVDTAWYTDAAVDATEYKIGTAEELAGLAQIVNTCVDSFAGKTVKLVSNIDLNNLAWTPIGDVDADDFVGFQGTFDGQGYTINNLFIGSDSWGQGLFGYTETAVTVKNVKVYNANVTAGDTCGVIFGLADKANFSNIHVSGTVSVIGTGSDGHVGGIVGRGYYANFENCSVVSDNGVITSAGSFVGGIAGYQCDNSKVIADCSVEGLTITGYGAIGGISGIIYSGTAVSNCSVKNVVLNKTRADGNPSIGAIVGNYSNTSATTLTGKVENVTLNGTHIPYADFNVLYGSEYQGRPAPQFDVTGVVGANTVTNNLVEVIAATPSTVQTVINNAEAGATIVLGKGTYKDTIVMKSDITLIAANNVVVHCINLNGADNIVLKNITFDAAGAKMAYDGNGKERFHANILSGASNKNAKGTNGLVIDGCVFTGTFANGGTTIAFNDQGRGSGQSGDITIKNCEFKTTGAYVDIYTYYSGKGSFVIENNTFASNVVDRPIYLGKYQSSTPVVVKNNVFEKNTSLDNATFLQDHSSYGVSFDASNNTFGA